MANDARAKPQPPALPGRESSLKPGKYKDGSPLHSVHYLECKIILKPDHFTSAKGFADYAKLVKRTARENDVEFTEDGAASRPAIREVLFLDTPTFALYNNAFILRRRISYEDGFPVGDPEIVLKFRHPDIQTAAEMDIRPQIAGKSAIKFKAEALPLKDQVGSYRLLFSHNVQFPYCEAPEGDQTSMTFLAHVFPCLASLLKTKGERVELVNQTIVEEVLQDLGTLSFGKGMTSKFNVAIWRERGFQRPLIAEFAFQVKFKTRDELHDKAVDRATRFFIALQESGREYVSLGTTKTGTVYRIKGNPPQAHE